MYGYPSPSTSRFSSPFTNGGWRPGGTNGITAPFSKYYGSIPEGPSPTKNGIAHLSMHPDGSKRARFDFCKVIVYAIIPAIVFAIVAGVLSFHMHYAHAVIAWLIVLCCLVPAGVAGTFAAMESGQTNQKWMIFLCVMSLIAWVFGILVGSMIYGAHMQQYYDILSLNMYASVNPSLHGAASTDAGRIIFTEGSHLDMTKAMGVRVTNTYCVVPVVLPNMTSNLYDYWAVGTNCCSSVQPQVGFNCPMVNDFTAHAGMRSMDDTARPYFRMAVQEAEATFKIQAQHPIFLNWMPDPTVELASWSTNGWYTYLKYAFSFLVFMLFLGAVAMLAFSAGYTQHHECKGTGFGKYAKENPDHDPLDEEDLEVVHNRPVIPGAQRVL